MTNVGMRCTTLLLLAMQNASARPYQCTPTRRSCCLPRMNGTARLWMSQWRPMQVVLCKLSLKWDRLGTGHWDAGQSRGRRTMLLWSALRTPQLDLGRGSLLVQVTTLTMAVTASAFHMRTESMRPWLRQ